MRKIAAQYLIPGDGTVLSKGMVTLADDGTIVEITDFGGSLQEGAGIEFYNGVLIAGLVNTHLHLELSHLHQKIAPGGDLAAFIEAVGTFRGELCSPEQMRLADRSMFEEGIVACADISNGLVSAAVKQQSLIEYHTFVELFGTDPNASEQVMERGRRVCNQFRELGLSASLTPHAPYSVSPRLWDALLEESLQCNEMCPRGISIHLAESDLENELFLNGTGALANYVKSRPGAFFAEPLRLRSVQALLPRLVSFAKVLSVHNTFLNEADIDAILHSRIPFYFVLCPRSNLFIGNRLPNVDLFVKKELPICLGTDSLASNHSLSVLAEMVTLQHHHPLIPLHRLVEWATLNGSRALGLESKLGSLFPGKRPGIMLLENLDLRKLRLTPQTTLRRLAG